MRKRMLAMLLACCLIGGTLSGCGGKTENSTESSQASAETAKTEQEDTSGERSSQRILRSNFLIRSRRKQHSRHTEMRRRIFIKNIRISLQKLTQFQTAIRFSRQEWLQMMYRQSFMENLHHRPSSRVQKQDSVSIYQTSRLFRMQYLLFQNL